MMDFLSNNLDRHGGNLLRHYSGNSVMAIDHSRSFQYQSPNSELKRTAPTKRPRNMDDSFGPYHADSSIDKLSPFAPAPVGKPGGGWSQEAGRQDYYDRQRKLRQAYQPAFEWWGAASPKIRAEMDKQLQQIKDPEIRAHIKRNFDTRADWLDERADIGVENYGDEWHKDGVPMYRPGELTDDERRQAESRAAAEQWARENPDKG
jgi:hypothetical protein